MPLATQCFTGFSRDDQAKAQQLFAQANAETGGRFELVPEAEAQVLVIDMDSMYGHMTWLKAQDSGKTTVGLTAGERCETDFMIKSPMSSEALRGLLRAARQRRRAGLPRRGGAGRPCCRTPAPRPAGRRSAARSCSRAAAARTTGQQQAMPRTTGQQQACRARRPAGGDAAVEEPARVGHAAEIPGRDDHRARWRRRCRAARAAHLRLLAANGARRPGQACTRPGAPVLALDPSTQTYAGSATLKPLLPYVEAVIRENQLEAISSRRVRGDQGLRPAARSRTCACSGCAASPSARATCCRVMRSTASSC
jgi:hypothetical protein